MAWSTCAKCKCQMWIDDALNEAALRNREKISFYCSYGHSQSYCEGESEETKLRRERDRLKQDAARLEADAREAWAQAQAETKLRIKAEAATKRLKKRTSAGTCPCCQRTFANMAEHMKHQHPDFVADGGAKVVPIKRKAQA